MNMQPSISMAEATETHRADKATNRLKWWLPDLKIQ
jgi:hypothetical protein